MVRHNGELKADLPLKALSGEAPEYDRPWTPEPAAAAPVHIPPCPAPAQTLLAMMGSPALCSRRWIWEQYDSSVMADTVQGPGGDAAVVRVHGTQKAIAVTADVTPRYCRANPFEGGKQAVAEAYRNLTATGATPLAVTDNLNFGNPERPEIMGQFVVASRGSARPAGRWTSPSSPAMSRSIMRPTAARSRRPPPSAASGLLADYKTALGLAPREGDTLILLGETRGHLGQSLYLAHHGLENGAAGDAPPVDLTPNRRRPIWCAP